MNQLIDYMDHVVVTLATTLEDESTPPTKDEMEQFSRGVFLHIKALAAEAPVDVKQVIRNNFLHIWDLRTDKATIDHIEPKCLHESIDKLKPALKQHQVSKAATPQRGPTNHPTPHHATHATLPSTMEDAVSELWKIENKSRLRLGTGFKLNVQGHAKQDGDGAEKKLFSFVESEFFDRPTVKAFVTLLDNYERELGKVENFTAQEKVEMKKFLDEVLKTPHMHFLHAFLKSKNLCGPLTSDLSHLLFDLWFAPYRRIQRDDSSGFEHVFVGEETGKGTLTGFHNWIQFYIEEKKGLADYLGWNGARPDLDDVNTPAVISCKFKWDDDDPDVEIKSMSTFLLGTTPEFELAMLTLVFLCGAEERNWVSLGGQDVYVRIYKKVTRFGPPKVACAFVEM